MHNTTAVSRVCVCVPLPISGPCGMITVVFCGTLPVQLLCVCSTAFPHRTRAVPFAVPTVAQQTALPTTVVTPAPRSDKEISRMYQVRVMAYSCNNPCDESLCCSCKLTQLDVPARGRRRRRRRRPLLLLAACCCLLSAVCCLLSAVSCCLLPAAAGYRLSAIVDVNVVVFVVAIFAPQPHQQIHVSSPPLFPTARPLDAASGAGGLFWVWGGGAGRYLGAGLHPHVLH